MYGIERITIEEPAWRWLESLDWPGNIRQLRQTVERAVLMSGKSSLSKADFVDPDLVGEVEQPASPFDSLDRMTLDEMEKLMIEKSLVAHGNNISQAATALGLSRSALYRRLEKHGLGD